MNYKVFTSVTVYVLVAQARSVMDNQVLGSRVMSVSLTSLGAKEQLAALEKDRLSTGDNQVDFYVETTQMNLGKELIATLTGLGLKLEE